MSTPAPLIDRTALLRHRARAAGDPALFLHEAARDEVQDRLMVVNRAFTTPAVVTPFPQLWQGFLPDARIVPDDEVLDLAGPSAELVYVGKGCGDGGRQQADINTLLHDALKAGRTVARLKSGDPMVFGRAAEELAVAALVEAEVEIVPGVTAALAAASESVITVTERSELQSFVVTTGKSADPNKDSDWSNLVKPGVCVAFYMSVAQAWRIQTALMAKGVPGHIAADWIENVGKPECRRVSSRLDRVGWHQAQLR